MVVRRSRAAILSDCGCFRNGSASSNRQPARLALVYEVGAEAASDGGPKIEGCYLLARAESTKVATQSPRPRPCGTSPRLTADSRNFPSIDYASASLRDQRNLLPSAQMRCRTTASLRESATIARRRPRRFATATPHAFNVDQRCVRVSKARDA